MRVIISLSVMLHCSTLTDNIVRQLAFFSIFETSNYNTSFFVLPCVYPNNPLLQCWESLAEYLIATVL